MSAWSEDAATIEPLLDRAARQSGAVVAGSSSLEKVLLDMEDRLDATIQLAEAEIRRIDLQTRQRNSELAIETRRHLATLRSALLDRATTVARSYDSVLGLLDHADRALAQEVEAPLADPVGTR